MTRPKTSRRRSLSGVAPIALLVWTASMGVDTAQAGTPARPADLIDGQLLTTGQRITPLAMPGATFQAMNPNLPSLPDFVAGQAVALAPSPDGKLLLALTSGFNRNYDAAGQTIAEASNEYVFVYDTTGVEPRKLQVLQVPNSFNGVAWAPDGTAFYVTGGVDDNVHVFTRAEPTPVAQKSAGAAATAAVTVEASIAPAAGDGKAMAPADPPAAPRFAEQTPAIALGHAAGIGIDVKPMAAGVAVDPAGKRLLVTNYQNESVSLVDLARDKVAAELDLRPGKTDPAKTGVAGGEYPFAVIWQSERKAYVSSQRDRELVVVDLAGAKPVVAKRIALSGQPNHMILNRDGTRLYVTLDNTDTVAAIDTDEDRVLAEIPTTAPASLFLNPGGLRGANPNNLALSPDEHTLFVTNGGTNAVAVVQLGVDVIADAAPAAADEDFDGDEDAEQPGRPSRVIGLIPTGWYPSAVAIGREGRSLYVVNGKSEPGPNPLGCANSLSVDKATRDACAGGNDYILQLTKAGFLTLPMPTPAQLAKLTWQVGYNNNFPAARDHKDDGELMAFLRSKIKHVIYVVKENRTYDQVLGDLEVGNGDPELALLLEPISPNHHQLARQFVTLDNFFVSGEISATGWNWTTAARSTDFTEKTSFVNYANRGFQYDYEGANRGVNVGLPDLAARKAANPKTPDDPDVLPGTADVAAPDSAEGESGAGYLWDAALKAGLTLRNYGFYGDDSRYDPAHPNHIPPIRDPFAQKAQVFYATKAALVPYSDPYFSTFDMKLADFWRMKEWKREFDQQVVDDSFPALTLLRLPHDHFGDFDTATDGVNTIETQMADNDYALGHVVERVAKSRYKDDTLIFVIEDDAQDGADHVSAFRSIAYVVGPYVKQKAVVSAHYTTVDMLRTIEEVLGLPPLGLNDGLARPMAAVFDPRRAQWTYEAFVPKVLRTTQLPLPPAGTQQGLLDPSHGDCYDAPRRSAAYWTAAMAGQNFRSEDRLDAPRFNAALWTGLKGESVPLPDRDGRDLSADRPRLLADFWQRFSCGS